MANLIPGPKGLHIQNCKGDTLSIQYGPSNYVDNRDYSVDVDYNKPVKETTCVELAMWNASTKWYKLSEYDDVAAYFPVELFGELLTKFLAGDTEGVIELTRNRKD